MQQLVRHCSVDINNVNKYDVVKSGQFRGQLLLLRGDITEPVFSAIQSASYVLLQGVQL